MINFIFYRTLNSQSVNSVTVANLAALLRAEGYSTKITLLRKAADKECLAKELAENAEQYPFLFYKCNSMDYEKTLEILQSVQQLAVYKKIFLLGPFASLNAERLLQRYDFIDGIVLGSGENTVLELAGALSKKTSISSIDGIVYREKEKIFFNTTIRPYPLTKLPMPARDVDLIEESAIANLEFSRGCENRCKYCHLRAYYQEYNQSRTRKSVDQVIEEIQYLYSIGKRYLIFNDSVFWNDSEDTLAILELCDRIIALKLEIFFMVYLSLYHFPEEALIDKMREAGLIRIFVGVESMDKGILENIKENTYPSNQFEIIRDRLTQKKISFHIGYMVFYPFSTLEQVSESINYLHSIGKTFRVGIVLEKMRLIPHTPMEQYVCEEIDIDSFDRVYAYHFSDARVDKCHRLLQDIFENRLEEKYIHMELLCCGVDLVESVCAKKLGSLPAEVACAVDAYRQIRGDYSELIYQLYRNIISYVAAEKETIAVPLFEEQFQAYSKLLEHGWSELLTILNRYFDEYELKDLIPV